jgi:uncharacterized membrane protein
LGVLVLVAALGITLAATVIGLVTLWPGEPDLGAEEVLRPPELVSATVLGLAPAACAVPGRRDCRRVTVELGDGDERAVFTSGNISSDRGVGVGDDLFVYRVPQAVNGRSDDVAFYDFDRRVPLLGLAALFALLVVALGRFQGLRSLIGLIASLAIIIYFVVPAILDGSSPTGVALVGALAVMFLTIPLSHGVGPKTLAACLGTTLSLLLTLGLAQLASNVAHLTGLASEEASFLRAAVGDQVSLRGLLIAGMVIAALGVLDDVTVSQASTVMALRSANPALGARSLFRRALGVGRDHIAATVNTLVLAYAGAALPVLLLFSLGSWTFTGAVNSEIVAAEVVATIVGSIGLIAAVPITTALAAFLAVRFTPDQLATDHHAHAH